MCVCDSLVYLVEALEHFLIDLFHFLYDPIMALLHGITGVLELLQETGPLSHETDAHV